MAVRAPSRTAWLSCAAATALACAGTAQAQSEPAPNQLGEVVVTALRREQRLQEVPAAITALDAATLRAKGAQDLRDYVTTVPGVAYTESGLGAMRVTIRGVSDGIGATDPLTGIYIDETPVSETFGATFDPDIYDVDRVEILKGPQGTLYGAGSMGGTVRVIGKKPKLDVFEGAVEATGTNVAHGGSGYRVDGVINVPILTDRMALRLSAGQRDDAGWIDDVALGVKNGNTVKKQNVRAQLLLQPAPDTSVILGFMYQKSKLGLPWFEDIGQPPHQSNRIFLQSSDSEARLYSLTIKQDWDWLSLTSASNYLSKSGSTATDSSGTLRPLLARLARVTLGPMEGVGVDSGDHLSLFTQEVRLASKGKNRVDWLIGAFYSDGTTEFPQVFDFSQAPTVAATTTGAAFFKSAQEYSTRQVAAFGELTFNATEKLSLTAGLRVFDVKQHNITNSSGLLNGAASTVDQQSSVSSTTQKYLVKYQATRDNMVYAQAAQGYRNGGPTGNVPLTACGAALSSLGYTSVPTAYNPDKLWNYEIGSKNSLLDGRMQLNAAAYYIDWTNIQSTIGLSCGFSFVTNAGKAVSKGVDLDASLSPIEGLTLTGSLAYVDAKLTEAAPGTPAHNGDPLPLTAKWSWNLAAQYEHDLPRDLTGFARGELNHVGSRWNTFRNNGSPRAALMDAYTTVGARVGVRTDRWSAALFGANLTGERILTNVNLGGTFYDIVGRPRTVGVNVRTNF